MKRLLILAAVAALAVAIPVQADVPATALAKNPGLAGVSPEDVAFLAKLYNAALKSGMTTVNVYSANAPVDPNNNLGVVLRAFEKTFPGIKVVGTRIAGAELSARLEAEIASGHRQGDIVGSADDYITRGLIEAFDPPLARNVPKDWHYPGNYYTAAALKQFGLVYNTRLVKPNEVPKTLDEALSPKWRGRVTIGQPNGVEPIDSVFATLWEQKKIDKATLQKIATAIPRRDRAPMASIASSWVAQGRYAIALWATSSVSRQLATRGAPVGVAPFPLTITNPTGHALLKGAPSPDAAKLLLAWLFSPTAQRLYGSAVFEQGTVPGSQPAIGMPKIRPDGAYQNPLPGFTDRRRKVYREIVAPIFGPAT
jgi:iron(III) transport system substrate-binding protein